MSPVRVEKKESPAGTIPKYHELMLPLLRICKDSRDHSMREVIEQLAQQFSLSQALLAEMLPSGQQTVFENRIGWARTYLTKSCLLEKVGRGTFRITQRGLGVLKSNPKELKSKDLEKYAEFLEFRQRSSEGAQHQTTFFTESENEDLTPEESLETGFQNLKRSLSSEVLEKVKECTPSFFERLVVELLLKMGYGGSRKDAGEAIGKTGDGGIDGIIKEDRLGLDSVYIQAKCWNGNKSVGSPDIQQFAGALQAHRARKGVFITTSRFSQDARVFVSKIDSKIILIDGEQLAQLMIDFNVGVSVEKIFEIKKIDSDYFAEEK